MRCRVKYVLAKHNINLTKRVAPDLLPYRFFNALSLNHTRLGRSVAWERIFGIGSTEGKIICREESSACDREVTELY